MGLRIVLPIAVMAELLVFGCAGPNQSTLNQEPCREERISRAGAITSVTDRIFDESGRVLEIRVDHDVDGEADSRRLMSYTHDGLLASQLCINCLGVDATKRDTLYYAENGELVRREHDWDNDGTPDIVTEYIQNVHGQLGRTIHSVVGDWTSSSAYEYDDSGLQITILTDDDMDGVVDVEQRFTYDQNGQVVRIETDDDGDADPDELTTSHYDDAGRVVRRELTYVNRPLSDSSLRFYYNETGSMILRTVTRRVRFAIPLGVDPVRYRESQPIRYTTSRTLYSYDEAGRVIRERFDENGDGLLDRSLEMHYECE